MGQMGWPSRVSFDLLRVSGAQSEKKRCDFIGGYLNCVGQIAHERERVSTHFL